MLRRHLVALVVLALLPLTALGLVAGASPASAKIVRVKAPTLAGPRPIGNEVIGLTGNLGRTVVRPVKLQRRYGGRWHTVAVRTAGPKGHYAFSIAMPGATALWRVTAPAIRKRGKHYAQRLTRTRTVYSALQTAYVGAARSTRVNAPVDVTMSFAPARPGRAVALQLDDGSGWQTVANLTQNSAGRATYRLTRPVSGVVRLRALAGAYRGAAAIAGPATDLLVLPERRTKVAAHRGFSGFYPENTLEAYSGALNNGADWVETDFQQTAPDTESEVADPACNTWPAVDGKPEAGKTHWVALHNAGFLATTDVETEFPQATNRDKYTASGIPLVEKFTLCEIKRLDAGSWKTTKWNTDGHVARVPTLEETLDLVRQSRNTTARVMVEPKLGTPQEAVDLYDAIKAYDDAHAAGGYWPFVSSGHDDRALFDTFGLEVAKKLASDRPDAEVSFIADEAGEADGSQFAGVSTLLADSLVTQARIDAIHQKGQDVVVWTVNDDDRWLELAARGVDVVITDQSKRARQVLTGTD